MINIGDAKITLDTFFKVAVCKYPVQLTQGAIDRITTSRDSVEQFLEDKRVAYGITTGFGSLKDVPISQDQLATLQENLIKSHAVGVGEPAPDFIVRGMFLLRLTCIANGNSGVRLSVAQKLVEALNKNFIPLVPVQGTVGASGDLAPLSHLIYALLGGGKAFDVDLNCYTDAKDVLAKLNIEPIALQAKEGLALNNGTQFITSWCAIACYNALRVMKLANIIASMTIEALHGVHNAFDERIHASRPHTGQIQVAQEIRGYLRPTGEPSDIFKKYSVGKVQDAYSLRCIPQIHGSSYDLIQYCKKIIETEMNSSTDNPLIFGNDVVSGGNFHGMYISQVGDLLALAMSYLCNNSERRTERMVNHSLNNFMPSFLVESPGLNSGFMIVQYAAAGITAENRHLAHPGSVDTIPTCEGSEDIVSMGGWPARKSYQSVENTYKVLGLELFTACQALEFTPEKPAAGLLNIYNHVRKTVPRVVVDTYMKDYQDYIIDLLHEDTVFNLLN